MFKLSLFIVSMCFMDSKNLTPTKECPYSNLTTDIEVSGMTNQHKAIIIICKLTDWVSGILSPVSDTSLGPGW